MDPAMATFREAVAPAQVGGCVSIGHRPPNHRLHLCLTTHLPLQGKFVRLTEGTDKFPRPIFDPLQVC